MSSWDSILKTTWEEEAREFLQEFASDTLDAVDRLSLELKQKTEEQIEMIRDMVQKTNANIHLPFELRQNLLMECKEWLDSVKVIFNNSIRLLIELETSVKLFLEVVKVAPIELVLQSADGTLTNIPAEFGLPEIDRQKLADLIRSKSFEGLE
jgi:hypothetical protein